MASPAACAACNGPITSNDRFVLSGTEAFHRNVECIRGIARSALTRAKAETIAAREEALSLRRELAEVKISNRDIEEDWDATRKLLLRSENALVIERGKTATERIARERIERDSETSASRRRQLENDLAAARAEIVRLQADAIRRATDDLPAVAANDQRDATEIRFSLLEIDEP